MNRKDRTRLLIANSLKQLSITKPLSKITIADIAEACGINRSTFYYHFLDKDDVIEWIFQYDIENHYVSIANGGWRENFRHAITAFQRSIHFYQQALALEGIHNLNRVILHSTHRKYTECIEHPERLIPGLKSSDLDESEKRLVIEFYSKGLTDTYLQYIQTGAQESIEEMTAFMEDLTEGYQATLLAISKRKKRQANASV